MSQNPGNPASTGLDTLLLENRFFDPTPAFKREANAHDPGVYAQATADPESFWASFARSTQTHIEHLLRLIDAISSHYQPGKLPDDEPAGHPRPDAGRSLREPGSESDAATAGWRWVRGLPGGPRPAGRPIRQLVDRDAPGRVAGSCSSDGCVSAAVFGWSSWLAPFRWDGIVSLDRKLKPAHRGITALAADPARGGGKKEKTQVEVVAFARIPAGPILSRRWPNSRNK